MASRAAVVKWLLDSDPAIRWQVLRDLTGAPAEEVAEERARIATEGWGARLLSMQQPDGRWGTGPRAWEPTLYALQLLRQMGLDPSSAPARAMVERVRERVDWGAEFENSPFFEGEVEPCINGATAALGGYFAATSERLVDRLLGEQLSDGGWNCEAERGSVRSSFHTTICVLEGLFEYARAKGSSAEITRAQSRAHEYLLSRAMFRRLSTGEVIEPSWTRFAFPTTWHYDVLRGLDYLRSAGVRDERLAEAVALVASRGHQNGRWPLGAPHPDPIPLELEEGRGKASRWNTLRALRVVDWFRPLSSPGSGPSRPR
jgi:hypothetical protein